MNAFQQLLSTTERLLGPDGCPWDREQTMKSTRPCVIEEASEVIDAIDSEDNVHIREELGDLFFVVIFLCKLAEKEQRCTLHDVLQHINEKLIRRHPHVFGNIKLESSESVIKQWGEIKKQEEGKTHRKSALDGIPKGLPALARAQKVLKKIQKSKKNKLSAPPPNEISDEDSLGNALWGLILQAEEKGLDAEHALRKLLVGIESTFREEEEWSCTI